MRQEVRWYLAEALAEARAMTSVPDAGPRREAILARYSGAVDAFRHLDELTEDEGRDWRHRMLVALGIAPPEPTPLGVVRNFSTAGRNAGPRHNPVPAPAHFVRSVPGPDAEFERHGGRLRVVAAEIYDTVVAVRWRFAPEPDVAAVFPAEAAQLARDLEGTDDWAAAELRKKAERRLRAMRLHRFSLHDDVGTQYRQAGGRSGGSGNATSGETEFAPTPPPNASALTFTWLDVAVEISLS